MRSAAIETHRCACRSISRLADMLPMAMWVVAADGTVVWANRSARELPSAVRDAPMFVSGASLRLLHMQEADVLVVRENDERACFAFGSQHLSAAVVRHIYGFSAAEARVAVSLAAGQTPRQVADELLLSLHTVRTHIKSIFGKTRTRSQNELVALLARGIGALRLEKEAFTQLGDSRTEAGR
jgi:DNA-binding CsgD family transcriptional regulator